MNIKIGLFLLFSMLVSCGPAVPSDAELAQMTRSEKWACLKQGMKEQDVLRILGKPTKKKQWSGQTTYTFECFLCTVTFNERAKLWAWNSPEEIF